MSNNYRRGFDGWIYGLHGFNNISDVKGDGTFSKITTFVEGLNIPMGIYPVGDGRSVIAFDA